jgi:hypothetical protein
MSGNTTKRYPAELRERAVRMVAEIRAEHESEWAAMTRVTELVGGRNAGDGAQARCRHAVDLIGNIGYKYVLEVE